MVECVVASAQAASQSYTEANDGASSIGNDVLRVDYNALEQPATPSNGDAAELSNIVLGDGEQSLIQGTSADVTHGAEEYKDGDMFRFRSGAMDLLTIHLDWTDANADLDFFLFEENDYLGEIASFTTDKPEVIKLMVEPNKTYWLLVGGHKDSSSGSLPEAYKLSLCGNTLTP